MQIGDRPTSDDVRSRVAEHALRSRVEDGDESFSVCGNDRHSRGGVEHCFALSVCRRELLLGDLSLGDVVDETLEQ